MRKDIQERVIILMKNDVEFNYTQLGKIYGCDYRTIKRYCENPESSKKKREHKPSKLEPFKQIAEEKQDLQCTKVSIYKFIKKMGYNGGYTILSDYLRGYVSDQVKRATVRFETIAGLQAQVDWKEEKVLHTKSGETVKFNIFLMLLGYSRKKYLELTLDRSQETLEKVMINALNYFEGVPKEIIFDNMRTVVDQSKTQYKDAVINEKFYQFSKDMGFEVWACRPYRPQTKGKVEALAKLTSRLDPYDYEFNTIEELQEIVFEVRDDLNEEISRAIGCKPNEKWQSEREYLLPLPSHEILDTYLTTPLTRKVSKESMIVYNNRKYSLPTDYIGKIVEIKVLNEKLYIMDEGIVINEFDITEHPFNYKYEDMVDILKSDAMKYESPGDIEDFAREQLKKYDSLEG